MQEKAQGQVEVEDDDSPDDVAKVCIYRRWRGARGQMAGRLEPDDDDGYYTN